MDVLITAALSPLGIGCLSCLALTLASVGWPRHQWRRASVLASALLSVVTGAAAILLAPGEIRSANIVAATRAGEASLAAAAQAITAGLNVDAQAALDNAERAFRAASSREAMGRVDIGRGDL